jgi:MFS transporter, ACS family, solute carrier family 17 (sodium-dependent inorganic phosphate cotransporter), other
MFFATCHNLISRWSPPEERGIFLTSLTGAKLGTAFTFPLMGFIVENMGWRCGFYVTAVCSLAFALIWFNIVADSPEKHSSISKTEQEFIENSHDKLITNRSSFPPITKMLTSLPFYALMFLHFSDTWGSFFLLTSAPMFMSQVLKFELKNAGLVSCFPYLARLVSGFLFGIIGDHLSSQGYNPTKLRKYFCILCKLSNFRL